MNHNLILGNNEEKSIREEILPGKKNVEIEISGNDSSFDYYGVLDGKDEDEFDISTIVTHVGLKAKSNVWIKGVLRNNSRVEVRGLIKVLNGAKGSDGKFKAEFLVFDNAVAKPIPGLEIEENDVAVGHSAWVTKVSEDMIFYLMTKGLSRKKSEKAIIDGFLKI